MPRGRKAPATGHRPRTVTASARSRPRPPDAGSGRLTALGSVGPSGREGESSHQGPCGPGRMRPPTVECWCPFQPGTPGSSSASTSGPQGIVQGGTPPSGAAMTAQQTPAGKRPPAAQHTPTAQQAPATVRGAAGTVYFPIAFIARFPFAMMVVGTLTLVVSARGSVALGGLN